MLLSLMCVALSLNSEGTQAALQNRIDEYGANVRNRIFERVMEPEVRWQSCHWSMCVCECGCFSAVSFDVIFI